MNLLDKTIFVQENSMLQQNPHTTSVNTHTTPQDPQDSLLQSMLHSISPVPETLAEEALAKINNKTKPLGSLGKLEELACKISMIQNTLTPEITQKNLFVFAADHGITAEGVSAFPSEVTAQMVSNFLQGGAAINVLCRHQGIDMQVIDIGVSSDFEPHPDLLDMKVARGTRNFAVENAMSPQEVRKALENGMRTFLSAYEKKPVDIVALGEMGIGNTTTATAIICAVTGLPPADAAGRGTGIDDNGVQHKIKVIEQALAFHTPDKDNGFEILEKIGGLEIAGIAGAVLAAASKKCTVVLDGIISTAAGLVAYTLNPDIAGYCIAGHKSVETAQKAALTHMSLEPVLDLKMRLGEGTGAAMTIDIADAACKIMCEMASFDDAQVAQASTT